MPNGRVSLGLAAANGGPMQDYLPSPGHAPLISITYPFSGDRFLLLKGNETLRLILKADCRLPFPAITWFVNGQEQAATGPPYELALELARGRYRLAAVGPDGRGDAVEVSVE
jgi:hypothetical protein